MLTRHSHRGTDYGIAVLDDLFRVPAFSHGNSRRKASQFLESREEAQAETTVAPSRVCGPGMVSRHRTRADQADSHARDLLLADDPDTPSRYPGGNARMACRSTARHAHAGPRPGRSEDSGFFPFHDPATSCPATAATSGVMAGQTQGAISSSVSGRPA